MPGCTLRRLQPKHGGRGRPTHELLSEGVPIPPLCILLTSKAVSPRHSRHHALAHAPTLCSRHLLVPIGSALCPSISRLARIARPTASPTVMATWSVSTHISEKLAFLTEIFLTPPDLIHPSVRRSFLTYRRRIACVHTTPRLPNWRPTTIGISE